MSRIKLEKDPIEMPEWVISDTHFGHVNIREYGQRPEDHEQQIYQNWRQMIGESETVLHLGDLALGKVADMPARTADLPGNKFLLRGNHDRKNRDFYRKLGFTLIEHSFRIDYEGYQVFFTHRPDTEHQLLIAPRSLNVHGHIHQRVLEDRRLINLSIEQTDYKPVRITEVLDARIAELASRD